MSVCYHISYDFTPCDAAMLIRTITINMHGHEWHNTSYVVHARYGAVSCASRRHIRATILRAPLLDTLYASADAIIFRALCRYYYVIDI